MAKKVVRSTGFANQTCNKCQTKAHTKPGSKHRNCRPGSEPSGRLPIKERGTWS